MLTTGIVVLTSAYSLKIVGKEWHRHIWGNLTLCFAIFQALGGFLMATIIRYNESYIPLFTISSIALLIGTICIINIKNGRIT